MPENIIAAINRGIEESGISLKELAEALGKPLSTLSRELNQFDTGCKLGAMELLPIMLITRTIHGLEYLAARLGYTLVKKQEVQPDKDSLEAELLDNHHILTEWGKFLLRVKAGEIDIETAETMRVEYEMKIAREVQEDFIMAKKEAAERQK